MTSGRPARLENVIVPLRNAKTFYLVSDCFSGAATFKTPADIHHQTQLIKLSNLNKLRC